MSSDLIFIIGRQRTGTSVFRMLLKAHGALDAGEIMHNDLNAPHRFYAYVADKVRENADFVHPKRHSKLFPEYMEGLRNKAKGSKIAIDLKYYAINSIPSERVIIQKKPFLLKYIKENNASAVHIVRKNKLRVHISELISVSTGKWSASSADKLPSDRRQLKVNVESTLRNLESLENDDKVAVRLLENLPNLHSLVYEEMFEEDGQFSSGPIKCARSILGCENIDPNPPHLRMNPESLPALVKNYDELAKKLKATRFAWMLED